MLLDLIRELDRLAFPLDLLLLFGYLDVVWVVTETRVNTSLVIQHLALGSPKRGSILAMDDIRVMA